MNRITPGNKALAEEYIKAILEDKQAAGMAACIIDRSGETQYEMFYGTRNLETMEPVDENTIFGLASVTKSFTALAVTKMAEEGKVSLDEPLSRYIPEFTNHNTGTVTLKHLLSHSGGFFPQKRIIVEEVEKQTGRSETDPAFHTELAERGAFLVASRLDGLTAEKGLIGKPGLYFSYCNDGFGLLSEVIRRYGGCASYEEYLQENILKPLKMERSGCSFVKPAEDENAAVLYKVKDGVVSGHRNYRDNAFVLHGGGAMKSTLHDLKHYLTMYLNEGKGKENRIVSADTVREMITPRIPYGRNGTYGYGLYSSLLDSMLVHGHGGSLPGVSSNIAFSYDNDCAVIVLCNTSGVPVSAISDALMRMYAGYDPLPHRSEREHPWSEEMMAAVSGVYCSEEGTSFEILQETGRCVFREDGKEKPFLMISPCTALVREKWTDTYLKVYCDEDGSVRAILYGSRMIPRKQ